MSESIIHQLPRTPECGRRARRLIDGELLGRVERAMLDRVRTVVTELVNNAYVHGLGDIELTLTVDAGRLRVEVVDQGSGAAVRVRRAGRYGGGHGLRLVRELATDWGAFEGTTHVWAEFAISH